VTLRPPAAACSTRAMLGSAHREGKQRDGNVLKVIQLEVTRERDIGNFYTDLKKYQLQIAGLKRQLRNVGNYSTNLVRVPPPVE
jgi:hypothetical protein